MSAITGAAGVAKTATATSGKIASAISKKLDNVAAAKQEATAIAKAKSEVNANVAGTAADSLAVVADKAKVAVATHEKSTPAISKKPVEIKHVTNGGNASAAGAAVEPPALVDKQRILFRSDNRSPKQIFVPDEGFKARGTNTDILEHAISNINSGFVSTSQSKKAALESRSKDTPILSWSNHISM